jgi:hypothetical protein
MQIKKIFFIRGLLSHLTREDKVKFNKIVQEYGKRSTLEAIGTLNNRERKRTLFTWLEQLDTPEEAKNRENRQAKIDRIFNYQMKAINKEKIDTLPDNLPEVQQYTNGSQSVPMLYLD